MQSAARRDILLGQGGDGRRESGSGSNIQRFGAALDCRILRFGATPIVSQPRSTVDPELPRPSRRSPARSPGGSRTRIDDPLTTTMAPLGVV